MGDASVNREGKRSSVISVGTVLCCEWGSSYSDSHRTPTQCQD